MNRYTELRERCEALPERKAREYLAELGRLSTRAAGDAEWQQFLRRLERAEYLSSGVRYSAPVPLRGGRQ